MPALPATWRPSRAGAAPADESVAQSPRRSSTPLVCGRGIQPDRAWRRPLVVPNYRYGRENDPARAGRTGRVLDRLSTEPDSPAWRWATEDRKKDPAIRAALTALIEPETAGDPMSDQKWVRSSLRQLSTRLGDAGHPVSPPTVGRLLLDLDYALHVNAKKLEARSDHADRDAQFSYIA